MTEELMADEKERAEHLMLVDLGRNDVGRIAKYGSVQASPISWSSSATRTCCISSARSTAQLRDGLTAMDAFRAGFPAGTLTGAPKVRAMEIIDEMEPERRGPYGGAVGYISRRREAHGPRDHDSNLRHRERRRVGSVGGRRGVRFDSRARVPRAPEQGARAAHRDRAGPRGSPSPDGRRRARGPYF